MTIHENQLGEHLKTGYGCDQFLQQYNIIDVWNTYGGDRDLFPRGKDYRAHCIKCDKQWTLGVTTNYSMKSYKGGGAKCFNASCKMCWNTLNLAMELSGKPLSAILKDGKEGRIKKYVPTLR